MLFIAPKFSTLGNVGSLDEVPHPNEETDDKNNINESTTTELDILKRGYVNM